MTTPVCTFPSCDCDGPEGQSCGLPGEAERVADAYPFGHPCSQEEIERTGVDPRQPDGVPLDWSEKYPLHMSLNVEPGTCLHCEILPLGEFCGECTR